jgi:hypothetical protein
LQQRSTVGCFEKHIKNIKEKKEFEKSFNERVIKAGKQAEYGTLLADFEKNYNDIRPYAIAKDYFTEVVLRNTEILSFGYRLYQLEQVYNTRGEQAFTDRKNNLIAEMYPRF